MLTVAEVLAMPAVRGARPEVVAGVAALDRQVRWVHTTELPDIAPLLHGGDLVLTTGIALPEAEESLDRFARELRNSEAPGYCWSWAAVGPRHRRPWPQPASARTCR